MNTVYTATIASGVQDLAGNALGSAFTWTFTTGPTPDSTAPAVNSATPADGASSVSLSAAANATFSKAMDPSTITTATFGLTGPGTTPVAGKVSYDVASRIATFTPASALASGMTFTATITTGAKDLAGNALVSNFVSRFVAGSTASQGPIDLGAATNFAVMAQATVTSTGATIVNGDIGLSPGVSVTGFPPGTINGTIQIGNLPAVAANASLATAYAAAVAVLAGTPIIADLGGDKFFPRASIGPLLRLR